MKVTRNVLTVTISLFLLPVSDGWYWRITLVFTKPSLVAKLWLVTVITALQVLSFELVLCPTSLAIMLIHRPSLTLVSKQKTEKPVYWGPELKLTALVDPPPFLFSCKCLLPTIRSVYVLIPSPSLPHVFSPLPFYPSVLCFTICS